MKVIYGDFRTYIHENLMTRTNYINNEFNHIKNELLKSQKAADIFFDSADDEFLRVYDVINKRRKEVESLFENKGVFDYCGLNLDKVLKILNIETSLTVDYTIQEIDRTFAVLELYKSNLELESNQKNKRDFIYLFTIFDSFLLEIINATMIALEYDETKVRRKLYKIGRKSIVKKSTWFEHLGFKNNTNINFLKYFMVNRHAIVHSCSKYSNSLLELLPKEVKNADNLKEGFVVEITNENLRQVIDTLEKISANLYEFLCTKFEFDAETKKLIDFNPERELQDIKFSDFE